MEHPIGRREFLLATGVAGLGVAGADRIAQRLGLLSFLLLYALTIERPGSVPWARRYFSSIVCALRSSDDKALPMIGPNMSDIDRNGVTVFAATAIALLEFSVKGRTQG